MKLTTPAANIVVATLYLLALVAVSYIAKLIFKFNSKETNAQSKYSSQNLSKGLQQPLMKTNINQWKVLMQGLILKYNIIGSAMNRNKYHLLKQIFIISVICVSCLSINRITLWPIALTVLFVVLFFISSQYFRLPRVLDICQKIEEQNKNKLNLIVEIGEIGPNIGNQQKKDKKQTSQQNYEPTHSYKYILFISGLLLMILILISQTMFTIYNSISNLGGLNISSVIIVVIIDQLAIRPVLSASLLLAAKLILYRMEDRSTSSQNQFNNLQIFQLSVFRNLCEDILIQKMNILHIELGQISDAQMGVSPSKKKTFSPPKVPKAIPVLQSETLMEIHKVDQIQEPNLECIQQIQETKSPIKQIQNSVIKRDSILFTSAQKNLFGDPNIQQDQEENQNNQHQINKSITMQNINKIKINPNQFFSIQRLPKQQLTYQQQKIQEQDGLQLVETDFNAIKNRKNKEQNNTMDFQFSPGRKKRQNARYKNKRRQLIITGSSPYLEYLPDMMKKEKQLRKSQNINPTSQTHLHTQTQPQVQTTSRRIL